MKISSTITVCDFCYQERKRTEAVIDGKTKLGPWANMCEAHFKKYGVGLGLGKGQTLKEDA